MCGEVDRVSNAAATLLTPWAGPTWFPTGTQRTWSPSRSPNRSANSNKGNQMFQSLLNLVANLPQDRPTHPSSWESEQHAKVPLPNHKTETPRITKRKDSGLRGLAIWVVCGSIWYKLRMERHLITITYNKTLLGTEPRQRTFG